jgi:NADPH-dependent curcumin reductase CurA
MNGFFVYNHENEFACAEEKLAGWILDNKLKIKEDITEGFNQMPYGLEKLYSGKNQGVALCKVRENSEFI